MASTVDRQGVTVTSGRLAAWFAHAQVDAAPPNPEPEGGVVVHDAEGREWVLDAVWMTDYRRARRLAEETTENEPVA